MSHRGLFARSKVRRAPFNRKLSFEALENRLLLSADPLASLHSDGLLRLSLMDGDDQVVVAQVGEAAGGGAILDLTRGAITERYGSNETGVREILAEGGGGDDTFRFLLFPAWLSHEVEPNLCELEGAASDRVSVSFNLVQRLRERG